MNNLPSQRQVISRALHGANHYQKLGLSPDAFRFDVDLAGELVISKLQGAQENPEVDPKEDPLFDPLRIELAIELTDTAYDVLVNPTAKKEYDEFLSRQRPALHLGELHLGEFLSLQAPSAFDGGDIVIPKDSIQHEGPPPEHVCKSGFAELVEGILAEIAGGADESISGLSVDVPEEKFSKEDILGKARELFKMDRWANAIEELYYLAKREIDAGRITREDFLGDSRLTTVLKGVAVEIWCDPYVVGAPSVYDQFLKALQELALVDIDSINQAPDVKTVVYAQARRIWKDYIPLESPRLYTEFRQGCLASGVVDAHELNRECYLPALGAARQIWSCNNHAAAPEAYATFLDECINCGVADKSHFNRECYQAAAQHIREIANSDPKDVRLPMFHRFVGGCVVSGVLTFDLVQRDPELAPYLKELQG